VDSKGILLSPKRMVLTLWRAPSETF